MSPGTSKEAFSEISSSAASTPPALKRSNICVTTSTSDSPIAGADVTGAASGGELDGGPDLAAELVQQVRQSSVELRVDQLAGRREGLIRPADRHLVVEDVR